MKHSAKLQRSKTGFFRKTISALLLFCCMAFGNSVFATNYTPTTFTDPDYTAINNATGVITAGGGAGLISLRSAIQAADNNGPGPHIITLLAGTYTITGGTNIGTYIVFGDNTQNITINGVVGSPLTTIIDMAPGINQDRIFSINGITTFINNGAFTPDVVTTINYVKFTNGHLNSDPYGGGAVQFSSITSASALTLSHCDFTNNTIDAGAGTTGGAVNFSGTGTLTVDNSTFTNNSNDNSDGGALYYFFDNSPGNIGTMIVTNCTFNNNTATATGPGNGGAIGITAQGRIAPFNQVFTANILKNTFTNNTAPGADGGAIIVDNGSAAYTININYNRLIGNNASNPLTGGLAMNANGVGGGNVNATNNWWGCNTGPAAAGTCDKASIIGGASVGTLTTTPWLQLKATASPTPICPTAVGPGNTSTVTASFLNNSAGTVIPLANLVTLTGTAPFAPLSVSFVNPALGTLSGAQANIEASGTATVLFTSTGAAGAGSVNAVVDNVPNNDAVAKAAITINAPAAISVPPANQTVCLGSTVSFTVTATGTVPISYQWYKGATPLANGPTGNGSTYAGATTNILTITGTALADAAANYNVQVSNSCANITSANVSLTVYAQPVVNAPTVTQPTCAVPSGAIVVNATGAATLEYSINNGTTWFSSATFSSLVPGNYTVLVRIQAVPTCSTPFAGNPVVINAVPVAPTVNAPTVNQPTCAVPTGTIVVNASGSGTLEYSVDGGVNWFTTNTFSGLAAGNYNIKVRLQNNTTCVSTYSGNPVTLIAATGCCVPPTITCPPNTVTAYNTPASCNAIVTYTTSVTGTVPSLSYLFSGATSGSGSGNGSGSVFGIGTTTVIVTATNNCGTQACSFSIIVLDTIKPMINCPAPVTVQCAGNLPNPDVETVTASDNCFVIVTWVGDVVSDSTCINKYKITRTYKATDPSGNSATCTQIIIVNDNTPPQLTGTLPGGVSGNLCKSAATAAPSNATIASKYADNCSVVTVTLISSSVTGTDCSWTATYIYSIVDACNNAAPNAVVVFTGGDTEPPALTGTPYAGTSGTNACKVNATTAAPFNTTNAIQGYTDNCSGAVSATLTGTNVSGSDCSWTVTYTFSVKDVCGNTLAGQTYSNSGGDHTPPIAKCKPKTITLAGGTATITAADVNDGSSDNCGPVTLSVSKTSFNCSNIGANQVTLTATDACNNNSTCIATVTVVGEIPTCSIASIPSNNVFTGGVSTNIYLGYGPQSTTLQVSAPASGAPYTYKWIGYTIGLSNTTSGNPLYTPTATGSFTFTVEVTNKYGCKTTCSITICVLDIREFATNGSPTGKVFLCHLPPGNPGNMQTLSISVNAVPAHLGNHQGDHLGKCTDVICGGTSAPFVQAEEVKDPPVVITRSASVTDRFAVKVYPNPTDGDFNIRVISNSNEPILVKIMDATGVVVHSSANVTKAGLMIPANKYRGGLYFVEVTQGKNRQVIKLTRLD